MFSLSRQLKPTPKIDRADYSVKWQLGWFVPFQRSNRRKISKQAMEYIQSYFNHECLLLILNTPDRATEAVYERHFSAIEIRIKQEIETVKTLSDTAIEVRALRLDNEESRTLERFQ